VISSRNWKHKPFTNKKPAHCGGLFVDISEDKWNQLEDYILRWNETLNNRDKLPLLTN